MGYGTETSIEESEQEQLLEETLRIVKSQSFEMKRALDRKEVMEGLRYASVMLGELRQTTLSPKFYYRLYIDVTNELGHFLCFLEEEYLSGGDEAKKVGELYELVQFAGSIIPRLYLMITVGVVYIKSKEAPRKDILRDLVEMCRGVQHPLKGLFLRNYLISSTKELLPVGPPTALANGNGASDATAADVACSDGDIRDALEIVMTNFSEMNKGPSREREKRERERRELRILVGTNLVRLSQLELLDVDMFKEHVLPGILEQSVSCKEPISQEYLMECVIQVFPDEFHLATLSEFLTACAELHPAVQIKNVLCAIINRLAIYAQTEDPKLNTGNGLDLFKVFSEHAEKIIGAREGILLEDIISIEIALVQLAIKCYPDDVSFANTVYESTVNIIRRLNVNSVPFNNSVGRELTKMLKAPIEGYASCLAVFDLDLYTDLLNVLHYRGRTCVCSFLIRRIIDTKSYIEDEQRLDKLFHVLDALLVDQKDQPDELEDNEDFSEEQDLVARLVHMLYNDDCESHFALLTKARKQFGKGGPLRLRHTLAPIVFATYTLIERYARANTDSDERTERVKKMFRFAMSTINALKMEAEVTELALKLSLQGALVADKIEFEDSSSVTYELVSNAFAIYEEDLTEIRVQVHCLDQMIGCVHMLHNLLDENHSPLRNQCAMYASRLLKKPDQARALCSVANLFWSSKLRDADAPLHDGQRVLECLKKAMKVSSQFMEESVQLSAFVHILSTYLHFYEIGCLTISADAINSLITKIREELTSVESTASMEQLADTFETCLAHARSVRDATATEEAIARALGELSISATSASA